MLMNLDFSQNRPRVYRVPTAPVNADAEVAEIGYNAVPPGYGQVMQRDVYIIHYVTKGGGVFMGVPFKEGDCYMVVPGEKEIIRSDSQNPYCSWWIMFKCESASALLQRCALPCRNAVFSFAKTLSAVQILKDALYGTDGQNPFAEAAKMQSVLYEILSLHMYENKNFQNDLKSDTAQMAAQFIRKNYYHNIKISGIAEKMHISQSYLIALFNKRYGMPLQEYLLKVRIEKAKQLLSCGSVSVKETALSVGFENPLYFSRIFAKRVGVAPSLYRNMCNAENSMVQNDEKGSFLLTFL